MHQRSQVRTPAPPPARLVRWVALATLSLAAFGASNSPATAYTEAICDQARAIFESTGERWTYLEHFKNGPAVSLNRKIPAKYIEGNATPARIIYLATGPRDYESWFGVRIAYQTKEKTEIINLKNSTEKDSFQRPISQHNRYHDGTLPKVDPDYDEFQFRFHMRNILRASDVPASLKKEYYYESWEHLADRRAYVIRMKGLRQEGSCVHFLAVIPRHTTFLSIKIIDIQDGIPITSDYTIQVQF